MDSPSFKIKPENTRKLPITDNSTSKMFQASKNRKSVKLITIYPHNRVFSHCVPEITCIRGCQSKIN